MPPARGYGRRLTAPWKIVDTGACFRIETADGLALAYVYYDEPRAIGTNLERLTYDEARRVAANIIKLPDLLKGTKR